MFSQHGPEPSLRLLTLFSKRMLMTARMSQKDMSMRGDRIA